jgi:hypothetical protein
VRDLENRLTRALGCKVTVAQAAKGSGGRVVVEYGNLDDLDRLLDRLLGQPGR